MSRRNGRRCRAENVARRSTLVVLSVSGADRSKVRWKATSSCAAANSSTSLFLFPTDPRKWLPSKSRLHRREPSRGRDFLEAAVCAEYPLALSALQTRWSKREDVACPPVPEEDFSGEWLADLKWVKSGVVAAETPSYQLKIVIKDAYRRYSLSSTLRGRRWKPGRFKLEKHEQSAMLTTTDIGWDFDANGLSHGRFSSCEPGLDEAQVAYLRVVNNPHMPRSFAWRAFLSFSEGRARRAKN